MSIDISDKIYLDKQHLQNKELLNTLTYKNPDYYQKMNLGLSVWSTPKVVKTYSIVDDKLAILRGEYGKVRRFIKEDVKPTHPPHQPINLRYVNNDFELDEFQNKAVASILGCRQGVVHAVTSAGKSLIIIKAICERNLPALIVVHRKTLMQQFLEDIKKYVRDEHGKPINIGIIGNGQTTYGKITIAIDKTLGKRIDEYKEKFGIVFLDECHLCPAETMSRLINTINSEHRFGVSGTLRRKDAKEFLIFASFGHVIATITKQSLLELKRIVPVKIEIIRNQTQFNYSQAVEKLGTGAARQLMEKTLSLDPIRNARIIELASSLKGKTLILSRLVEPCFELARQFQAKTGTEAGVITGKDSKLALASYNDMKHGDLQTIFATVGCVAEGVSISDLMNVILISPIYTNELLLHQIRGRLMRIFPGKTHGTLYFFHEENIFDERKLKKFLDIMAA